MNTRVRAIIRKENAILLIHRIKKGREYWVFPGGGVEKDDGNMEVALIRECKEELGVEVRIGDLFTSTILEEIDKEQREFFYFCEVTGGKIGTGSGPEFQKSTGYEGMYVLEWISMEDLPLKDIQPAEVKERLLKEAQDDDLY